MAMKPAVILGAGVYQLAMIRKLKARGFHVVTISRDGDYPGFREANEVVKYDIVDRASILAYCQEHDAALITTAGSDVGLPSIGLVNDRMNLPGIGFEAAQWASSKQQMKHRFAAYDVRAAQQRDLDYYMAQAPFRPFVAKLDVSSGSAGVFIIETPEDFARFGLQGKPDLVLEDFITGMEFGAQVVITDQVERIYIHSDDTYMGSAPVPVGHGSHFANLPFDEADLTQQVTRSAKALGLRDCVANYDFILNPDGIYILEVGARLGATGLAEMIKLAHGVDLYDVTIDLALGDRDAVRTALGTGPLVAQPLRNVESYLLFADKDGHISPELPHLLETHPDVLFFELDYPAGTAVNKLRKGSDRFGMIVTTADLSTPFGVPKEILNSIG